MLIVKRLAKCIYDAYDSDLIEESGKIVGFDITTSERLPYLDQIISWQTCRKGFGFITAKFFDGLDCWYYRVDCPSEWFKEGGVWRD